MIPLPHWGQHNRKEAQLSIDPTTPAPTDPGFTPDPATTLPVAASTPEPVVTAPLEPTVVASPSSPATLPVAPSSPAIPTAPAEAVTPTVDTRSPFEKEQTAAAEAPATTATPASTTVSSTAPSNSLPTIMERDLTTIFNDVDATELGKRVLSFFQHVVGYVEDAKSIMDMLNKK
jgi:hypothetical protein